MNSCWFIYRLSASDEKNQEMVAQVLHHGKSSLHCSHGLLVSDQLICNIVSQNNQTLQLICNNFNINSQHLLITWCSETLFSSQLTTITSF